MADTTSPKMLQTYQLYNKWTAKELIEGNTSSQYSKDHRSEEDWYSYEMQLGSKFRSLVYQKPLNASGTTSETTNKDTVIFFTKEAEGYTRDPSKKYQVKAEFISAPAKGAQLSDFRKEDKFPDTINLGGVEYSTKGTSTTNKSYDLRDEFIDYALVAYILFDENSNEYIHYIFNIKEKSDAKHKYCITGVINMHRQTDEGIDSSITAWNHFNILNNGRLSASAIQKDEINLVPVLNQSFTFTESKTVLVDTHGSDTAQAHVTRRTELYGKMKPIPDVTYTPLKAAMAWPTVIDSYKLDWKDEKVKENGESKIKSIPYISFEAIGPGIQVKNYFGKEFPFKMATLNTDNDDITTDYFDLGNAMEGSAVGIFKLPDPYKTTLVVFYVGMRKKNSNPVQWYNSIKNGFETLPTAEECEMTTMTVTNLPLLSKGIDKSEFEGQKVMVHVFWDDPEHGSGHTGEYEGTGGQ